MFAKFAQGLSYGDFLERFGAGGHAQRWADVHRQIVLAKPQRDLLANFTREMNVLCLAGAWCGDCVQQCPIFDHFAAAAPKIRLRFLDRDENRDLQHSLQVNGGDRVPVVVFFSEDGFEVARFGDRTLSKYRRMMKESLGAAFPASTADGSEPLIEQVTQDWLDIFERAQWILRLSSRLRQKHGD